jgi:hypothetical protein
MRNFILVIAVFFSFSYVMASEAYDVKFNQTKGDVYELDFSIGNYDLTEINIDGTTYSKILFDGSVYTQLKGFAQLPMISATVQLSADKNVSLNVIEGEYDEYTLEYPLLPSRGVIYRDQDPSTIPYVITPSSLRDNWYPQNLATNTSPFILKDLRGTSVNVFPFRYNAVKNVLRVYKTLTVELIENETQAINPLSKPATEIVREMDAIYNSVFINYNLTRDDLTIGEFGDLLVITTARDEDAIEPYIEWKKEKGYSVTKEVVATGTNVKNLIQNSYNANNDLLYVQLVGDWADIKSDNMGGAPMDPQLGCVVGSDNQPDICIGRFSANNPGHVTIQVNKSINYEKNPDSDNWYSSALGVASNQGPGDDNELDYEQIDVIYNDKQDPYTYDNFSTAYDPSGTASMVTNAINAGVSAINYCGHGSATSWGSTGFSNSHVNNLTNGSKLPFIFSVACVNGAFQNSSDCFAEAWLKKENGGAIVTLMATINQPWDPPMRGQDYFNDVIIGGYDYTAHPGQNGINTTEQRSTLGACVFNGLVLMTTESGSSSDWETAKTWIYFGDAAIQHRTIEPAPLALSNEVIFVGMPYDLIVTSNGYPVAGAMVCLSQNGEYYNAVTDASGHVNLEHDLLPGEALLVVTGLNTETYYDNITIVPPEGPYVIYNACEVDGNGQLDFGETANLSIAVKNVGVEIAYNVDVTISTDNGFVTILDDTENYGNIGIDEIISIVDGFSVEIATNIPDGEAIMFDVVATDGTDIWESSFTLFAHAPILEFVGFEISGSGTIDPGETKDFTITITNAGSASVNDVITALVSSDPYITVNTDPLEYGTVDPEENVSGIFSVTADAGTPTGHMAAFEVNIEAPGEIGGEGEFSVVVGQIPVCIIDLDDNHSSGPDMQTAIDNLGVACEYLTSIPADLSLYNSVFLCLGIYSNNHVLTSAEGQTFAAFLNDGGKLYMEGGDTWYYDASTPVHAMFNIDGQSDGSGDLGTINGIPGSFTEDMTFTYSGENSWIDHIGATAPAFLILENQSPNYGCGVAYDAGDYKTIGASFEFGGLNATDTGREELMEQYLEFFGLLNPFVPATQSIELSVGYQFISTCVEAEDPDMLVVLESILNENLDYVRNSEGIVLRKIGPNWINGIGDWIGTEGYLFKMLGTETLEFTGVEVLVSTPIDLVSGFQFVSYLPAEAIDALYAFDGILGDNLDYIRNSDGEMLRKIGPNWVNGIGDAIPGEGYLIKMFAADQLVYNVPVKSSLSNLTPKVIEHFVFDGGNAADPVYTMYVSGLEIGDEVAVYDGDMLVGSTIIRSDNKFENSLPLFSTLTNDKGYNAGNDISIKVWDNENQMEVTSTYNFESDFEAYTDQVFPSNDGEYSFVNILKGTSSIENPADVNVSIYPNPANDNVNIVSNEIINDVQVLNFLGQVLLNMAVNDTQMKINTSDYQTGVYIFKINTTNSTLIKKVTIK